jgi:hypothetical protein
MLPLGELRSNDKGSDIHFRCTNALKWTQLLTIRAQH